MIAIRGKLSTNDSPCLTTTMMKEYLWSDIHYQQDGKQAISCHPAILLVRQLARGLPWLRGVQWLRFDKASYRSAILLVWQRRQWLWVIRSRRRNSCGHISIINRMVNRQQAVIQPFPLFVDEDYNGYDSMRQAVVQLFILVWRRRRRRQLQWLWETESILVRQKNKKQ